MPNGTSSLCYERAQIVGTPKHPYRGPLYLTTMRVPRGGKNSKRRWRRVWV